MITNIEITITQTRHGYYFEMKFRRDDRNEEASGSASTRGGIYDLIEDVFHPEIEDEDE